MAAVAVLTLALGIGANAAMFALVEATLLRSPPVAEPDRLVMVYTTCRDGDPRCSSSYPDFLDYRAGSEALADLAAYSWVPVSVGGEDAEPALGAGQVVSGNYFSTLGVRAVAGRLLSPSDEAAPGVAVLSHRLWTSAFGRDPAVVGREVRVNGSPFTVVGVAPRDFHGLDLGGRPELWVPIAAGPALGEAAGSVASAEAVGSRGNRWIAALVGRLAPGATPERARAELLATSAGLQEADPDARGGRSITVDPVGRYVLPVADAGGLTRLIWTLFGIVGLVLLLTCANLANLLLARATSRRRELRLRVALGAPGRRLAAQLLAEPLLLALLGGAAGLVVAAGMLDLAAGVELPGRIPVADLEPRLGAPVLLFGLACCLVTALLCGLAPALAARRTDALASLRTGRQAGERGGTRLRRALVSFQVALCLVLLVGSGLFLGSLRRALEHDPGFAADGVALARLNPSLNGYSEEAALDLVIRVREALASLPGAGAVGAGTVIPMGPGGFRGTFITVEGYEAEADEEMRVDYVLVTPGYFRALGIPLRSGRPFDERDARGAPPVAVVSRETARRWWPDGDAVGGRIRMAGQEMEVVGVVGDAAWRTLEDAPTPHVFLSMRQFPGPALSGFVTFAVRGDGHAPALFEGIRERLRAADPQLPVHSLRTMDDQVAELLAPQRMGAALLTGFGALALVLAALGVYGVVSYAVARRTREIGVRMALGARRVRVLRDVLASGMRPVLLGLALGLFGALAAGRLVAGLLFRTGERDPVTLTLASLLLALVALAACLVPARRATRVDPAITLRAE